MWYTKNGYETTPVEEKLQTPLSKPLLGGIKVIRGNIEPIKHFSIDVANRHPVVCAEVAKKLDDIIMINDGYKIEVTAHCIIGDPGPAI